ncbi:uncharacterized protein HMPREF1541_09611 [Cyphellophora europaea CBS 101466]|uniref:Uncharacterized protein n=1 Tax=Cyphellophora europaea (strain CBS 101466) TaxID=1220924 RepID=W2SCL7_CYPE1|nr:uncharacterized protein HMPREF1541_09611 [Cyphellophora europaea CBS 101466]ETN45778.1 hypothetical protein HMPREF1541_09611 [Cyphellophora europaea CBS 101466]
MRRHVCRDTATALMQALWNTFAEQQDLKTVTPRLVLVSTTGVTRGPEDVPPSMRFLYHRGLALPYSGYEGDGGRVSERRGDGTRRRACLRA